MDTVRKFYKAWLKENLDYSAKKELSEGSPDDVLAQLIEDAKAKGITKAQLDDALGGNARGSVFNDMMILSDVDNVDPDGGAKH